MKLYRAILCLTAAGLLFSFPGTSIAQETSSATKSQKTQAPKKQQKKKADRLTFMDSVKASVTDLTDDQKAKLEALQKEAGAKHKEIHAASGITWEMSKKREEILTGMSKDKPYKERNKEASTQAGYSDDQFKKLKEVGQVYATFRFNGMKVLAARQQVKMPKWYQDEFKKASEAAAKKAAKEKEAEDKAKAKK